MTALATWTPLQRALGHLLVAIQEARTDRATWEAFLEAATARIASEVARTLEREPRP